jgi:hypothetical protein
MLNPPFMVHAIYIIAFNLVFLAYALTLVFDDGSPLDKLPNSPLMRFSARLGGVCIMELTIYGFWKLDWYLPLLAFLSVVCTAGSLFIYARRSLKAPRLVTVFGFDSLLLTL